MGVLKGSVFSFFPNNERETYRFGCILMSSKSRFILLLVAVRFLYKLGSFNKRPKEPSLLLIFDKLVFKLLTVESKILRVFLKSIAARFPVVLFKLLIKLKT